MPERSIVDEGQYAPELFSAIQAKAGRRDLPGQFVLSGSQSFLLLRSIKQSLAGRVGVRHPRVAHTLTPADPAAACGRMALNRRVTPTQPYEGVCRWDRRG
nr:AAA family ATPase [Olsenella uli]